MYVSVFKIRFEGNPLPSYFPIKHVKDIGNLQDAAVPVGEFLQVSCRANTIDNLNHIGFYEAY
jgi:hypothetical protein